MPQEPITAIIPGQFRNHILSLKGRQLGAFKRAAKLAGLEFYEYLDRLDSGAKRCVRCRLWLPIDVFGREISRWDGRDPKCLDCHARMGRENYKPVPFDQVKIAGPPRHEPRDDDKIQARRLINSDVKRGWRPDPNVLHCVLCGHKGRDRRHEYHHHMGYAARHHYDVIPVCSKCHHAEH